ncbi:hypothetical protein [Aestuariimicrobium sp. Y1814]|uniref:hypothetical protein n=1 Tax=Aestuariimicrobium sp. Y1814 TaxID=3418742 RepID=UPI003DA71290
MRVPRRELYQEVATPIPGFSGTLGSLLARCMHDEDCRNGLTVHNASGQTWQAYGDKRLLDDVSRDNLAHAVAATRASANDVWTAYDSGDFNFSAAQFIPDLNKVADVTSHENYSPLFLKCGGKTDRRKDVRDRQDFSWTNDWWGWSTYYELMAQSYAPAPVYRVSDNTPLGLAGRGRQQLCLCRLQPPGCSPAELVRG